MMNVNYFFPFVELINKHSQFLLDIVEIARNNEPYCAEKVYPLAPLAA